MRILAITNHFPLPQDTGGPVRILGLLRVLAEAHELQVLALRRRDTTDTLVAQLSAELRAPVEAFEPTPRARPSAGPRGRRWARSLKEGMPPWVLEQFHPELCERAIDLAPEFSMVVLLDDYAGVYARPLAPLTRVVADKHHVHGGVRPENRMSFRQVLRTPVDVGRAAVTRRLMRRFERAVAADAAAVLVTSAEEAQVFETTYGLRPHTVPSAVQLAAASALTGNRRIGWLGTHAYAPNVEGLVRFVEAGWDAIGDRGFELLVAGGRPTSAVQELTRHRGVQVLGYVDDLAEFMAGLDAGVVPLWAGAGIKLKTLTLMGAGIPLACTPVAVEGLSAQHGQHCLIADDPAAVGAALCSILDDPVMASRLGAEARRLVRDGFTWESVGPRFLDVVERAATGSRHAVTAPRR